MGVESSGSISYFELTNALRTELRIMNEEKERERAETLFERSNKARCHENALPVKKHVDIFNVQASLFCTDTRGESRFTH